MKRFLLLAVAALAFVGCNEMFEDEGNSRLALSELPTLTAGFEDATRTYVENNKYLRWHEGDLISAFVGDTKNVKYIFDGKTGDASGEFKPANDANAGTGNIFDKIYAVYPYEVSTAISNDGVIRHNLPTFQTYADNSFGKGANPMVAVAESMDDTSLIFKNVCGYLKIKLYGEGTVKSIELRGNNGEKIAGNVNITATYGGVPKIAMADDATESITLDCGQGVELSADADNPTEFWVVLPPMEFSKGITIVATDINKGTFEQSTSKKVVVERNIIQPMATIKVEFEVYYPTKPAKNEIWYTSSDGNMVELDNGINNIGAGALTTFGANIVSHTYENGKGVIKFDGDVTTIGYYAFYGCDSLTSVTIGDSVTTIGIEAFRGCESLTSITIPNSVTTIGDRAFEYCDSLTSVTIGDSVTTIGYNAFYRCYSLTSITIPNSVITIGSSAFEYCDSLTSVTIGDSVTTIGYIAFQNCRSLKEFKGKFAADNGRCLIMENTLIAYAEASGPEYAIPDNVTTIGSSAFAFCDSLTSITIPNSVTTIGSSAFAYCYSLTSVTIGDNVTTIGNSAFAYCDSLTSITIPDSVTTIGSRAFAYCDSLTSVTIGDSVTTIGYIVFLNCRSLKEFKGKFAADNGRCLIIDGTLNSFAPAGLTEYTIPDSVTTIGEYAFSDCDSLTSITIPDSVTAIGESAFAGCRKLTSVYCKATIPPVMESSAIFDYNITDRKIYVPTESVYAYKSASGWNEYADAIVGYNFETEETTPILTLTSPSLVEFGPEGGNGEITFTLENPKPGCSVQAESSASWVKPTVSSSKISYVVEANTSSSAREAKILVTYDQCYFEVIISQLGDNGSDDGFHGNIHYPSRIPNNEIWYMSSTETIITPNNTTDFGANIVSNTYDNDRCVIEFDGPVTKIPAEAFKQKYSLTEVVIPHSVTEIGANAFYNCSGLTAVFIGNGVETIGNAAFRRCAKISSITIPNSVKTIGSINAESGEGVFESCKGLTNVIIGSNVSTIGNYSFNECEGISKIVLPNSVITVGNHAFSRCANLTTLDLGNSVTTIGDYAFYLCAELLDVDFPTTVKNIEQWAFGLCSKLKSIELPDSITEVKYHSFAGCSSVTSIHIPNSVTYMDWGAFSECTSITNVTIPESVVSMGPYIFLRCYKLNKVICERKSPPTIDYGVFYDCSSNLKIYVPAGCASSYRSSWSDYKDNIVGDDGDDDDGNSGGGVGFLPSIGDGAVVK